MALLMTGGYVFFLEAHFDSCWGDKSGWTQFNPNEIMPKSAVDWMVTNLSFSNRLFMCESFTFCDVKLVSKRGHEVVTISHRRASYSAQDGDVLTSLMTQLQTDPDAYWKERFQAELLSLMFMPSVYWLANLIERFQNLIYIYE